MAPSRRMQKQGVPEPLNESLVSRKRKDAPPPPEATYKKRRTDPNKPKNSAGKKTTKGQFATNGKTPKTVAKKAQQLVESDDEDFEDDSDAADDLGVLESDDEPAEDDDFMDSDDPDVQRAMWSEDEDASSTLR